MTTAESSDTGALKARRKAAGRRRGADAMLSADATGEPELPPLPESHASMTEALGRPAGLPVLDPLLRTRLAVAETGGHVPSSAMTDYVVAEFDAAEQMTPRGCRTAITRTLWMRGQHVRRDVYATYLLQHPEMVPVVVELPEPQDPPAVGADGSGTTGAQGEPPVEGEGEGSTPQG
jgi:hypothetical protein